MNVVAVTTFFPYPLDSGDPLRVYSMLRALNSGADELTVVAVKRSTTTDADVRALEEALPGARVITHDLSSRWAEGHPRLWKITRGIRSIVQICPPWVLAHWSRPAARTLPGVSREADLTVLLGEGAGQYAKFCESDVVWDKSNVLAASNRDAVRQLRGLANRLKALASWPLSYVYERRQVARCRWIWTTSEEDGARFADLYHRTPAATVKSPATRVVDRVSNVDPNANVLYWMSSLAYPPNVSGLQEFLSECRPTLLEQGMTLRVVGYGATDSLASELADDPVVDFVGFAEDLSASADGVCAAVVPLWAGAGVKLKTLTLLDMGLPIIATPVALEGIDHGAAVAVPATPSEFRALLGELEALRPRLADSSAAGPDFVRRNHSTEALTVQIRQQLREFAAAP